MPQRFLRPGITTSHSFNHCTWAAQTLWLRLLTLVDDYGRHESHLVLLSSLAFPLGDCKGRKVNVEHVELWLQELEQNGLLDRPNIVKLLARVNGEHGNEVLFGGNAVVKISGDYFLM